MPSEAADILAKALEDDAAAHEAGQYSSIGERYDDVYGEILPIDDIPGPLSALAFRFWDDWCDASQHDWMYHEPIRKEDWPLIARTIAKCLRSGELPTDPLILREFTPEPRLSFVQRLKQAPALKFRLSFWLGVVLLYLGYDVTFVPGSEITWFAICGVLLFLGFFSGTMPYRIFSLVLGTMALWRVFGYLYDFLHPR